MTEAELQAQEQNHIQSLIQLQKIYIDLQHKLFALSKKNDDRLPDILENIVKKDIAVRENALNKAQAATAALLNTSNLYKNTHQNIVNIQLKLKSYWQELQEHSTHVENMPTTLAQFIRD